MIFMAGSKKRPFELDGAELDRLSKQERINTAKAIEEEVWSRPLQQISPSNAYSQVYDHTSYLQFLLSYL